MSKHKSNDYKLAAVKHYLINNNQSETCKIFNCSERSLIRWVKKYKQNNSVSRKTRKYIAYKVTNNHIKFINDTLKKNKTIAISDLTNALNEKFKVNLSMSHIHRVIRDNYISLKQTRIRHEPNIRFGKPVDINKQLKLFYSEIAKHKLEDIICIDETSLNSNEIRKHCYERVGKRCIVKTSDQEVFKKYTGIFAINNKKCIGYEIYHKGGIDSNRLIQFINKFITGKFTNKLIILDNASSHRNQAVKTLITSTNNLLYSVPYQHYTNAIENFFRVLKNKLRKSKNLGYNAISNNIAN